MFLAEADFTPEAGVDPMAVAALTFQVFGFDHLTTSLMFKLIVFTQIVETKAALKYATSMIPHSSLTFNAVGISESTATSMGLKTLPAMADPGLAEVADGTHHL